MKKLIAIVLVTMLLVPSMLALAETAEEQPIEIKALILPKFEAGEMSGDFPGEAQYYYEAYCQGGEEYDIVGGFEGNKLYVKDGVALYVTGMGKVNTSMSLFAVLSDDRFDFSNTYVISTGCAGSSTEYSVMGDVFLITAAIDYDLGHHADIRDLPEDASATWFHDESYDSSSCKILNQDLMDQAWNLVKDVKIETTDLTRNYMAAAFDNAEWATRDPQVLRGTTVTGDNYWKGEYDQANAVLMTETYGCPDPYALTEMEDVALAVVMDRMGMLDRFIIVRDSVNMDVFMNGASAASLWDPNFDESLASESSVESADIFATAMENNYKVGSVIIDAILDGTLN
jgi:purine nucleoside permease